MVEEKHRELKQSDIAGQIAEETETPQRADTPALSPDSEMGNLKKLLDSAIEEENYEEAARLRDRIRELEST
jgi:protein-arginine kinase activator protein McsA